MEYRELKLAAYSDEAGDDIATACQTLQQTGINYAVLRTIIGKGNVCDLSDKECQSLKQTLHEHRISPIILISNLGDVSQSDLQKINQNKIARTFNIATYFKVSYLRINIGKSQEHLDGAAVNAWMNLMSEQCRRSNLVPLLEIAHDSATFKPTEIVTTLAEHKDWQLLYDPAQFIIRQNQDPFVKYWTLLKNKVAVFDLRDLKIGYGFKPIGFGDAKIKLTLDDAIKSHYDGWYCLEPSLGYRHGPAVTRSATFKLALEALERLLE